MVIPKKTIERDEVYSRIQNFTRNIVEWYKVGIKFEEDGSKP